MNTTVAETPTYEDVLGALADERDDVVVMTAENRAPIRGLPARLGARFIDVGICEQTLVGAAAGLALRGRRPVVHALASFLTMRAFEFIRTDVGLPGLPVTLVGYIPGVLSEANGPTHQALEDVALMRGIPGMDVYCPADRAELGAMLPDILERDAPAYVRYNAAAPALEHTPFAVGHAEVATPGAGGVSILTYGFLLREALRASARLESHGVPVRVVNLRTLVPLDREAVLDASRCELLVTFEDHFVTGGLFSIVAELLVREGLRCRVLPIGFDRRFFRPALLHDVLEVEGLHGAHVAQRVLDALVARAAPTCVPPGATRRP